MFRRIGVSEEEDDHQPYFDNVRKHKTERRGAEKHTNTRSGSA